MVRMKISAKDMKNKKVKVKVWEEDNFRWTNDLIFEQDYELLYDNNFIWITLTKKMFDQANDGSDSSRQDYFIEVIYNKTSVTSDVMPVSANAEPTKVPKGRSVTEINEPKQEKKEETKTDETCGINYRNNVSCVRFGKSSIYGPVFWGSLKLAGYSKWDLLLSSNKITLEEKDIIIGMSENEGNLDSVQSYDSEIVTVGAMQKTVNPEGYGEFHIQMHEFKEEYPDRFKKLFENCGWNVKKRSDKSEKKRNYKMESLLSGHYRTRFKEQDKRGFWC